MLTDDVLPFSVAQLQAAMKGVSLAGERHTIVVLRYRPVFVSGCPMVSCWRMKDTTPNVRVLVRKLMTWVSFAMV